MNKTILVVEDSATERTSMVRALEPLGYRVIVATDGEEGLVRAQAEKPDLVLLDVVLPRKNGYQVCRLLKTSPETRNAKVVLVTSKTQDADRYWGMKQGADAYLAKPVAEQDLLDMVRSQI